MHTLGYWDIRISGMDIRDKDQFICWMQRALDQSDQSHTDDNYIELYNILLRWRQIQICHGIDSKMIFKILHGCGHGL